jgi:hypothetical protein
MPGKNDLEEAERLAVSENGQLDITRLRPMTMAEQGKFNPKHSLTV